MPAKAKVSGVLVAAIQNGGCGLCVGRGSDVTLLKLLNSPFDGDLLVLQQQRDLREPFGESAAALVEAHAELRELVRQEGAGEADLQPAVADAVEHADLAGHLQRLVEGGQHGAGDQPGLLRHHGCGGEKDQRIGAIAAVGMEVVLDLPDVRVAEFVGQAAQVHGFAEILLRRLLVRADAGKEVQSELHHATLPISPLDRRVPHRAPAEQGNRHDRNDKTQSCRPDQQGAKLGILAAVHHENLVEVLGLQ